MASAAEQLAANMNFGSFQRATDLHKRIWFTLGAMIVYRLGTFIPIPGIDPAAFERAFAGQAQGILGMFNMFSGGAVERMAVFALNVMPYISASIIVQLLGTIYPPWEKLRKEGGEAGRKTLNQYTRYLTVILALFQSFAIATGLQSSPGLVLNPGVFFLASTVVALIQGLEPRRQRTTEVGHLSVRASALDVKTVGAGGGSIAYVPELTGALRVGPQSAGAVPGPAAYGKGGTEPTVTDANVVLGYLPENLLGGSFKLDRAAARAAVKKVADALGLGIEDAAAGIIAIVNENMFGALRLVSIAQGYDPRDFALMPFGGAGPLHGNAMSRLMGSWPVLVPPSPGVLCAYGDATTRLRVDAQRSFNKIVSATSDAEVAAVMDDIAARVGAELAAEGVSAADQTLKFEVDVRYAGQAFEVPLEVERQGFSIAALTARFDAEHKRLFTFNLGVPQELVNIRVVALGKAANVGAEEIARGDGNPAAAKMRNHELWMDGKAQAGAIYDRAKLRSGDTIKGPAIVIEMDSTTLIHAGHVATVDTYGNILIRPEA